jgi:PEP-CTERM motif
MIITCTKWFLVSFVLTAVLGGSTAQATVHVGLVLNPSSTAGGGATSTRSGNGSWQLYALDDNDSDFGISSYNISMSGTTAINHRSPITTVNDLNGDPQTAGFSGLRSGTNANPIVASQGLPGTTPFLITGFGQTASNFTTKATAIDAGAFVVGPTTSGSWGNYNSPFLAPLQTQTGNNWVFLAEGLGASGLTSINSAVVTVYSNQSGTSVAAPTQIHNLSGFPPVEIVDAAINNVNADSPGSLTHTFQYLLDVSSGPVTWSNFAFDSYVPDVGAAGTGPAIPATFDPSLRKFSWTTIGSPLGVYTWRVTATVPAMPGYSGEYSDVGFLQVHITQVPEPATLSLFGLAIAGIVAAVRHRRA